MPDVDQWVLELKYDGFRCIATIGETVKLYSRRGNIITKSYPEVVEALRPYRTRHNVVILDGELVAHSEAGDHKLAYMQKRNNVTSKDKLLLLMQRFPVEYAVFDVIANDAGSLTTMYYEQRKEVLRDMPMMDEPAISYVEHFPAEAFDKMWKFVKDNRLEGVVAKNKRSQYQRGQRSHAWRKIKY
jgi:bifunctional non-homologous end joining protein LigD